jgi:hypothetical protein
MTSRLDMVATIVAYACSSPRPDVPVRRFQTRTQRPDRMSVQRRYTGMTIWSLINANCSNREGS